MANPKLIDYIKTQLKSGHQLSRIKSALRQQGWNDHEIEEALDATSDIPSPEHLPPAPHEYDDTKKYESRELGIFDKIIDSLASPTKLFHNVKDEELSGAFKYYAVISLIPTIVFVLIIMAAASLVTSFTTQFAAAGMPAEMLAVMNMFLILGPLIGVLFYIIGLFGSFLSAAITHIFAKIYSSKGSYNDTYKAFVYSSTPSQVLFFLPGINVIWSFILQIKGMAILHKTTTGRAALIVLTPLIIGLVLGAAWGSLAALTTPFVPIVPIN